MKLMVRDKIETKHGFRAIIRVRLSCSIPGTAEVVHELNLAWSATLFLEYQLSPSLVLDLDFKLQQASWIRALNRLGQGQGHYDRTFAKHPGALRIGLAWSVQETDSVPINDHDIQLHMIVTESEIIQKVNPTSWRQKMVTIPRIHQVGASLLAWFLFC